MPSSTNLLLLLQLMISGLMLSAFIMSPATGGTSSGDEFSLISIAECKVLGGGEMEISRGRMLETTRRYISYDAMKGNSIPCSQRGASYYNCRSGGQANPYQRGCSAITRCRR